MLRRFLATLVALLLCCHGALAQQQWLPGAHWDRLPPARSGWSEAGLADAKQLADRMHATGVMIVHHGAVAGALYETSAMARARPKRGSHAPGTFWYYNNWDFNALGTIYEHATGSGIYDALDRQIARPIGMQEYRPSDAPTSPAPIRSIAPTRSA
jgi:CubicO group peptidase (beta-lactamase class C family)